MKLNALIAAVVLTAGLTLASTAYAFPQALLDTGTQILVENVAYGCGPGYTRGPYGACRPRFTCPRGWHPGRNGNRCFRNNPDRRYW